MAEDAAYSRHGLKGGCKPSTVAAGLAIGASSFTGADLATWAGLTTNGKTWIEASYDTTTPEVMQATAVAGNSVTGITRGLRGTTERDHDPNCKIRVVHTDRDFDEANRLVAKTFGLGLVAGDLVYADAAASFARIPIGVAAKFLRSDGSLPSWAIPTITTYETLRWALSGEIKVASGDTDFLIEADVNVASNEVVTLVRVGHKINSGTSATVKIQKGGVDVTGFTGISVTTTHTVTDPADVALADGDRLTLIATAVSATPKNMKFNPVLKRVITVT